MLQDVAIAAVIALAIGGLGASQSSSHIASSWQVDTHHSDVQLITDATTDYGKTKMNITLGFGRVNGTVIFDNSDLARSIVDLRFYPATSNLPSIVDDGRFRNLWLANLANRTLVCFHSKRVIQASDGKLQVTGTMVLTRVDRSIQADANGGYAGPVYGPPVIHHVSHEMTLVFDPPVIQERNRKEGIMESASTEVLRGDFPPLLKAVTATYWPPLAQDETCRPVNVGEDYHGFPCTGTMLEAPGLPEPPQASNGEDIGSAAASDFNAIVGERLNILVHMRLLPKSPD
jgi:polyisoprenoid-binding protein YceI